MQPSTGSYKNVQSGESEYKRPGSNQEHQQQTGTLGAHSVQLIQGEKDTYELVIDITRKRAEEILAQTGLEIAFAQGESVRTDFSLGRGQFGVFRVGYATKLLITSASKSHKGMRQLKLRSRFRLP